MAQPLRKEWLESLALSSRHPPELFLPDSPLDNRPHSAALRIAFEQLSLSAVFCINDVPTIGFLVLDDGSESIVDVVHAALWNQGLMTLLLVISDETVRAYSLARLPIPAQTCDYDPRLVQVFHRVADALELQALISGMESGRWWSERPASFDVQERVDQVILDNLTTASAELQALGLPVGSTHALLMQTMFIAYLEDRQVILPRYFSDVTRGRADSFAALLSDGDCGALDALFRQLHRHFNGDIFIAPCAFDEKSAGPTLESAHLQILWQFRLGNEVMASRQGRFWGYDFRYIPVALLSAVYDRFLGDTPKDRRQDGAYYTPMFLVDVVVGQLWEELDDDQRLGASTLDPACGSGVFLVRMFERFVEYRRARLSRNLVWHELLEVAARLHGTDINASALRVAVFSIYIALLEQVSPRDIHELMQKGHLLPGLWGASLRPTSFFDGDLPLYDVVLGNPPWTSRRTDTGGAQAWCKRNDLPCPSGEAAWGFVWRAGRVLKDNGLVAFLLPAMGVLHNHADEAVSARRRFLKDHLICRIINFSDLTFQLFDGAIRPAALIIYRNGSERHDEPYVFDYWCPKADLNLRLQRFLTLSRSDRARLRSDLAYRDPKVFKRRLWMRSPDEKLFQFLETFPRLGDIVGEWRSSRSRSSVPWVIGQGFQPAWPDRVLLGRYAPKISDALLRHPYLDARAFRPVAQPTIRSDPWPTAEVRRKGFEAGFEGPHILIPQGVERHSGRVRAAYTEQGLSFRASIQGVRFPLAERGRAKLLTALLNSKLAAWFYFHDSANLGTDRAKVHQSELLNLPFPAPGDLNNSAAAQDAEREIVAFVDECTSAANDLLQGGPDFERLDALVYRYFGLEHDEVAVIDDTLDYILPSMQPAGVDKPRLWNPSTLDHWTDYTDTLERALLKWMAPGFQVFAEIAGSSQDLVAVRITRKSKPEHRIQDPSSLQPILNRIWGALPRGLPGNFQVVPDLRVILNGDIYMVKPRQVRYWLRSSALSDADEIAADLHQAARALDEPGVIHAGW